MPGTWRKLPEKTSRNLIAPVALAGVGKDMENFYHEVFALLLSQIKSSATNQIRTQPE